MELHQREMIEAERRVYPEVKQREFARQLKNDFSFTFYGVPLATVYNHIRRFDKRNAATKTAGLAAGQEPATAGV